MKVETERRALQAAVAAACVVPLLAGLAGAIEGATMVRGMADRAVLPDLDSHMRYLSGLLLGIGIAFASCIPRIERAGPTMRLLGAIVVVGGLARASSYLAVGVPGLEHRLALAMELGAVPLLVLWQWRLERRWARGSISQAGR